MDPEACLQRCEAHLNLRWSLVDAVEALIDYWDWRDHGGFEPKDGDARARRCALTIVADIAGRCK